MYRKLTVLALFMPLVATAAPDCPSNFSEFLLHFETDINFQIGNTKYPLSYSFLDGNTAEPKTIQKLLSRDESIKQKSAIFPSSAEQKKIPLEKKILKQSSQIRIVHFNKPDTDYVVDYSFKQNQGCWQLIRVENWSL